MYRKLIIALATAASLAVAGCGSSSDQRAGNGADRAFVAEMVPHHTSAVDMAKVGQQRGQSQFVKQLSADIIRTQNEEISTMKKEDSKLADDGIKRGDLGVAMGDMGMDMNTDDLKTASPFDVAFVKMMTPHHVGAVTMAKAELAKGKDPELKKLAQSIIAAQQKEIAEMSAFLKQAN